MKLQKNQIIFIGIVLFLILLFVLIFSFGKKEPIPPKVNLVIWGIEPQKNFEVLINAYKAIRPNVEVAYRQIPLENYKKELLNALASQSGPDILMIQSKKLLEDIDKLYPVDNTQFNLNQLRNLFPQVVEDDFFYDNKIYALPLYIDTLALFYNQDYFNKAKIVNSPKNWEEFADYSNKLKVLDANSSQIIQAGSAMGADENSIAYAPDILKLLLKQYGVQVFNKNGYADLGINSNGGDVLNFYTSFANPQTANYTWPRNFGNSIDEFSSQKAAMIFAYNKDIQIIKNKNPFLNFKIAETPQVKNSQINYSYSNYWGLAVSKQSKNSAWAWDFIINTLANYNVMQGYVDVSLNPPALKYLINQKLNDPNLSVFAYQALIARSWQEKNMEKINQIFNNIILGVNAGKYNVRDAIRLAQEQINQALRGY
jgi:ABC-type glycerol-3-phosphate transport system substrate-binding protein